MNENYTPCSPDCRGWDLFDEGNNVCRCDECKRFISDVEALHYAVHNDLSELRSRVSEYLQCEQLEDRMSDALRATRGIDFVCDILRPDDKAPGEKCAYVAAIGPLDHIKGAGETRLMRLWLTDGDKLKWRAL